MLPWMADTWKVAWWSVTIHPPPAHFVIPSLRGIPRRSRSAAADTQTDHPRSTSGRCASRGDSDAKRKNDGSYGNILAGCFAGSRTQGNCILGCPEAGEEVARTPDRLHPGRRDPHPPRSILPDPRERQLPVHGQVLRAVAQERPGLILPEGDVPHPRPSVLDPPVAADRFGDRPRRAAPGKLVREDRTEVVGVCSPTERVCELLSDPALSNSQTRTSSRPWFFSTVRLAWSGVVAMVKQSVTSSSRSGWLALSAPGRRPLGPRRSGRRSPFGSSSRQSPRSDPTGRAGSARWGAS